MSDFIVHHDTAVKYDKIVQYAQQRIEVPVRYVEEVKISGGRTRMIERGVTALGTVDIEYYGRRRVEYGKCHCNGHVVLVVKDSTNWRAVDRKAVQGCTTKKGA